MPEREKRRRQIHNMHPATAQAAAAGGGGSGGAEQPQAVATTAPGGSGLSGGLKAEAWGCPVEARWYQKGRAEAQKRGQAKRARERERPRAGCCFVRDGGAMTRTQRVTPQAFTLARGNRPGSVAEHTSLCV